jgi:hypothetical protein
MKFSFNYFKLYLNVGNSGREQVGQASQVGAWCSTDETEEKKNVRRGILPEV